MAIAKYPKRTLTTGTKDKEADAFIARAGAGDEGDASERENKKQTVIRIPPALLKRVDRAAERLGISRSAFIVQSAAEKLERME